MLTQIKEHLKNIPGWTTNRKIVVIESDDWGSIRMASKEAYHKLLNKGYPVDKCPYNSYDSLESNDDVEKLMIVLNEFEDINGNPAKFTLNNIVANPDFNKIEASGYKSYFYEPFTETLKRYPYRDQVMQLFQTGISKDVFQPQFHGREHVHVARWLAALQNKEKPALDAFKNEMFTVKASEKSVSRDEYLDSFGSYYLNGSSDLENIFLEGIELFKNIWGFKPLSFMAPCYTWPEQLEKKMYEEGISFIQGTHVQRMPKESPNKQIQKKYHYQGQKNKYDQHYVVRNILFEPTEYGRNNIIEETLSQIDIAFLWKKPAIISSHRVNYTGSISKENRSKNLNLLHNLLTKILNKYPEVEFMSTDQLGKLMNNKISKPTL